MPAQALAKALLETERLPRPYPLSESEQLKTNGESDGER